MLGDQSFEEGSFEGAQPTPRFRVFTSWWNFGLPKETQVTGHSKTEVTGHVQVRAGCRGPYLSTRNIIATMIADTAARRWSQLLAITTSTPAVTQPAAVAPAEGKRPQA
ncbi:hypothetical protein SKAU_G00072780 [Synaphobranchus kaupii]|uniref:Uncharacterized protein n=1 Tax=Synaphobranchus kaupii TaxID=118154 RepID=A0A9Q1JBG6_SYNKA|nr:hypothetical protein SKAU_G00072780 [Synaphobranchus kaupii]